MARRKYRLVSPDIAASSALENLLRKVPDMTANYSRAMDDFARDLQAQNRYRVGVAQWISVMRLPEVRARISEVVSRVKEEFRRRAGLVPARPVEAIAR